MEILYNPDNLTIEYQELKSFICSEIINLGQRCLDEALDFIGNKEYVTALPLFNEMYRPIEEAKKLICDDESNENELRLLERECDTFKSIAEALQAYYIGIDMYVSAKQVQDDDKRFGYLYDVIHKFQQGMALVRGEDVEIIAMCHAKIGIIYYREMSLKQRAKSCFQEAFNLAGSLPKYGKLYSHPWYKELSSAMQEIQDAAKKAEDEKWSNKIKPIMDKLKKNGTIAKIWKCSSDGKKKMIEYILKNFPPKHIKNFDEKKPKLSDDMDKSQIQKALIKVISKLKTWNCGIRRDSITSFAKPNYRVIRSKL